MKLKSRMWALTLVPLVAACSADGGGAPNDGPLIEGAGGTPGALGTGGAAYPWGGAPPAGYAGAPPAGYAGAPPAGYAGAPPAGYAGAPPINNGGAGNTAGGAPGGGGGGTGAGGDPGTPPPPPPPPAFDDPGTGPWVPVTDVATECGLDKAMLDAIAIRTPFKVVRFGKMCFERGTDAPSEVWSTTKTLGATVTGIASYETRDIPRTGPRTGQLSDMDRADHWLASQSYNRNAHVAHVLAMNGHSLSLAYGSKTFTYDTVGSTQINTLGTMVRTAISQDSGRLGTTTSEFARRFLFDAIGMTNSSWGGTVYAYSWNTTLNDMARLGLLILHRGLWDGKRVFDESWAYKMTHPSFEDANTAYGYLTWLNAKEGGAGVGGAGGSGNDADPCAPAAIFGKHPHGLSAAPNCTYTRFSCEQEYDVGVWSAQGLGGQFIVGHPGLDLLIVAKNFSGGGGPVGLWSAIRPALVARDPMYAGNEQAFCEAYGNNRYAPNYTPPQVPEEVVTPP